MEELLRFEHVSFAYEDSTEQRPALRDCSVSIGAGERVAVLGSNGAGKSTFFLLANGVLYAKEGTIFFHGEPVGRKKQELNRLRRGGGLVFQDPDVHTLGGAAGEGGGAAWGGGGRRIWWSGVGGGGRGGNQAQGG